jgi:hypothetical protein
MRSFARQIEAPGPLEDLGDAGRDVVGMHRAIQAG